MLDPSPYDPARDALMVIVDYPEAGPGGLGICREPDGAIRIMTCNDAPLQPISTARIISLLIFAVAKLEDENKALRLTVNTRN